MHETDIYRYYAFGYNYRLLLGSSEGRLVKGNPEGQLTTVQQLLRNFLTYLNDLELHVTKQAASELRKIYEEIEQFADGTVADQALSQRISNACQRIDATLDAELQLRTAFIVTPKRFDLKHLLERPSELLGKEAQTRLSDLSKFDFSSACRAVAFGLPTAAAFHLMRCVEGALRDYYCSIVKRGRKQPMLWHPMIKQLRERRDAPPRAILDHLDNIRVNFRNPTQHPDARYDMDEAQDLLAVSIDALNRMTRDMAARA